ncbi:hypothetical protein Tsubulata_040021, partial [Turnera subulata]
MTAASYSKRPVCLKCSKPSSLCLCIRIRNPGLDNKVNVTILQHSLERKHPLNSARIAILGLANVTIDTVSDVRFDARITIRLLQPDSGRSRCESLEFDEGLETRETQRRKIDDVGESSFGSEELDGCECKGTVLKGENEPRTKEVLDEVILGDKTDINFVGSGEPVISAVIKKSGVITEIDNVWVPIKDKRLSFDQILASQVAADALAKGFVVQRFQKRQKKESVELEEYEEFEIVVPSRSLLLFPSDKAVSVDELKGMNFDVKNLIVLDGTWAKARRMYCENPWLRLLPHLKLDVDELSLFAEVRHQPKAGYLSTIESIVYVLRMLGDDPEGLDNLLDQSRKAREQMSQSSFLIKKMLVKLLSLPHKPHTIHPRSPFFYISRFLSHTPSSHSQDPYDPPFSFITKPKPKPKKTHQRPPDPDKNPKLPLKSDLPFDFRYSYSESNPAIEPIGFREPKRFSPFGPGRIDRKWTGTAAPAPSEVDMEKISEDRNRVLGDPLTEVEVEELVERYRHSDCSRQINLGKDGVTHNLLVDIHNHWKRAEAVRIKCLGVPTLDMDNICFHLEDKSGGKIIHRNINILLLFRGRDYDPRNRPVIPVMLWKPYAPIYPRLVKNVADGLTNGVYVNVVDRVREAFKTEEVVRLDCAHVGSSDCKRIGVKLRDLVPCVPILFKDDQIILWRGKADQEQELGPGQPDG